ncbi:MAG TPA: hypothetical protein VH519_05085 [Hyphomicrobiaceae bacterium]|jgi:hypothetical protein
MTLILSVIGSGGTVIARGLSTEVAVAIGGTHAAFPWYCQV